MLDEGSDELGGDFLGRSRGVGGSVAIDGRGSGQQPQQLAESGGVASGHQRLSGGMAHFVSDPDAVNLSYQARRLKVLALAAAQQQRHRHHRSRNVGIAQLAHCRLHGSVENQMLN